MPKPLVLFLDFNELAYAVIETSKFLLTHIYQENKLILFHIIEEALTAPAYVLPYLKFEFKKVEKDLNRLIENANLNREKVEKTLAFGERWANLERFLHTLSPELLIIGYKPHLFTVPLAEKLLERLELTFLAVKEKPLTNLKRILCFFDQSQDATLALKLAADWAIKTRAKLTVLNFYFTKHLASVDEITLHETIENSITKNIEKGLTLTDKILEDTVVLKIDNLQDLDRMVNQGFEVIFMGRKGETLIQGLGSFSKHILRTSKVPVCVVKA
jgi:nucleotide-binding universal stress UspA family protein